MTDTPVDVQGQKASLMADASLDHEVKVGLENQINTDGGKSLGTSISNIVNESSSSDFGASNSKSAGAVGTSSISQATESTPSNEIPTGLDAIKARGPQGKTPNHPYSV